MSFGDPHHPHGQQPPPGPPPGHPQQAPQGVPPQYGYPQPASTDTPPPYGYPQQAPPPYGYPPHGGPAQASAPYGQPPQAPPSYGYPQQAPPPYGQPPQAPPPYGYPPQAPPPYGAYPSQPYGAYPSPGIPGLAHWGLRLGAHLLDSLVIFGPMLALAFTDIATSDNPDEPGLLGGVGMLYGFVMAVFQLYLEGSRGQSTGKKIVGISLLRERDGRPLGFGMAFVRKLAHALDSLACYLGWLWPLWDEKKQTLADKVCGTVVVTAATDHHHR
ncbi:RDD family protein [Streptomyces sp. NPDC058662]|uniref:RDD family protein n=1 Tax=Streptomyces sp. NPDC058662 TaxID=3346583 RepID=UPI00364E9CF8